MAITNLVPVFDRITKPNFKLISNSISVEKIHPRKFFLIIILVLMSCFLIQAFASLMVNSDAFTLQELKRERNLVQDQRDAILIQVNQKSSPEMLASAAIKLGMKPAESITYIDLSSK